MHSIGSAIHAAKEIVGEVLDVVQEGAVTIVSGPKGTATIEAHAGQEAVS